MKQTATAPAKATGQVAINERIARDTYRLRVLQPEIAAGIEPGQFLMVRVPGRTDPLLARPYALYDTLDDESGAPAAVDIVYLVVGNGTRSLSALEKGAQVELWGPLGNTFPAPLPTACADHLMIVAGGIGQTPFVAVIRELLGERRYGKRERQVKQPRKISFAWGVRSSDLLGGIDDFRRSGVDVAIATDDGSQGHHGLVTELVQQAIGSDDPPTAIYGCGPEPMLKALCDIAGSHQVPAWISLETKMACGYGVCFSCVCPLVEPDGWDYHRVCTEGSIFPAEAIYWEADG